MSNNNDINKKHHIFLAYHGDDITGSQKEAENIYYILKNRYGDDIDIYFHPISSPHSSYHDTPREVMQSAFFLLVAKDNIPTDNLGMISQYNKNNELSDLYQEVDIFYNYVFIKNVKDNKTFAKVIRVGNLDVHKAEDFYYNLFKSENYSYEEIIEDFENSLFFRNWFSQTYFYKELHGIKVDNSAPIINKPSHKIDDGIYETEYLLNNNFTAEEIATRHVFLDNLTVDKDKFPDALDEEVEGTGETWKEMVSLAADCTANLVINNTIVGYMDFLPVKPETYDLLKTKPFSDSDVAYYTFGGDYDIFVSMFSIDLNYATPKNYLLFFSWMINKILSWKEKDIIIHRIVFSIYSNNQAKALEQLGFKKVLENQLKGMLYENNVEDLLNNKVVQTKLLNSGREEYIYKTIYDKDDEIISKCKEIALSHSAANGGYLHFLDAVDDVDILIVSYYKNDIVGYIALKTYDVLVDSIYVEQIAIKKEYLHKGIGKTLLTKAIEYTKNHYYKKIYANCRKNNHPSYNLFRSSGFNLFDMTIDQYLYLGFDKEDIEDNYGLVKEL